MTLSARAPLCRLTSWSIVAAVAVAFGSLSSSPLVADTVELAPERDNTLYENADGAFSNGVGSRLFVGNTAQSASENGRRALLRFDVAGALPAGSTIESVTLTLNLSRTNDSQQRTLALHRLTAEWGEGASNADANEGGGAPSESGDATWIHRLFPTDFWANVGGDFDLTASAEASVPADLGPHAWSGAGLVADVEAWLAAPASNFGWILIGGEEATGTARRFDSREAATAANRPKLTLVFTPPPTSGACCVASGACGVTEPLDCTEGGGSFLGVASSCTPNPCPQPTGACCAGDGSCTVATADACADGGGSYLGDDLVCSATACSEVRGACCLPGPNDRCQERNPVQCANQDGTFLGGGSECGIDLCPFVDSLPIPAVATPVTGSAGGAATYLLAVTEEEQLLHRDLAGPSTVWTYGGSYPGPTIEASSGAPVGVTWSNDLRVGGGGGDLRTEHLLPVDSCLHGAETPSARIVTHLHGGHVPADSDGHPEATLLPGESALYSYPNDQLPGTLWYHDHALGITRLNVYLGLAGFYLVRDPFEGALDLPEGEHEIPLAIQDRAFLADGQLDYPAMWDEHFFGDTILVNGKVWPYLDVKRGKYRFRVLNGANARTLRLALENGAPFHQIGSEGGLLPAPVELETLLLSPGERADVVIDFAGYTPGTRLRLLNDAPAPFPGAPGEGVVADVLEFRVGVGSGHTSALPASLRPLSPLLEEDATVFRSFELRKFSEPCAGSMWMINGLEWDEITEYPVLGDTEVWSFVNRSGSVHPMHLHLEMFQILDRQPFEVVADEIVTTGPRQPPAANESGWKDTVAVNPFEIVRVIVKFTDFAGRFAYHCHILEHEDHEMMRQFETRPREIFADGFESGDACGWTTAAPAPACD